MLDSLAHLVQRRARAIAVASVFAFLIAGAVGGGVAERLNPYEAYDPASESVIATERLEAAGHFGTDLVVLVRGADARTADGAARVGAVAEQVAADPDVAKVVGYAETQSEDFVARSGSASYVLVQLAPAEVKARHDATERLIETFGDDAGVQVGGPVVAELEVDEQVAADLAKAETLAFPILFALAFLFFRSLVAALLPLMVGLLSIVATFFALTIASSLGTISVFALNLVTALGLALAIDYSLFIVSRYREEIARSGPGLQAMRRTLGTAGRTVMFSSVIVAGATGALCIFPQNFLYSMGIGGAIVALTSGLIALTVLPAVLVLLGHRVNALAPKRLQRRSQREASGSREGFWFRLSQTVMRAPGRIAFATAAILLLLGAPALGIKFNAPDAQVLPTSAVARQVDDTLRADFAPYRDTPATIAVNGDAAEAERVAAAAAQVAGADTVRPPVEVTSGLYAIDVISSGPPLAAVTTDLVRGLRAIDGDVMVTGFTANFIDMKASLADHLPLMLALIAGFTLIVLFVFTGSLILPFKQLVMNLLGLAAMFGILVMVFQDGRFEGLLAYTSDGAIEATQPLLLFALGFGLATDYGVFLLSRIKEAREQGYSDSDAVSIGLERTGRIVTAAALLFAVAVGAFVISEIAFIKQIGLGVALIVLIDATLIRGLLVPSLMQLLGSRNWWAPRPLRRLHAAIGIREAAPEPVGGLSFAPVPAAPEPAREREPEHV